MITISTYCEHHKEAIAHILGADCDMACRSRDAEEGGTGALAYILTLGILASSKNPAEFDFLSFSSLYTKSNAPDGCQSMGWKTKVSFLFWGRRGRSFSGVANCEFSRRVVLVVRWFTPCRPFWNCPCFSLSKSSASLLEFRRCKLRFPCFFLLL